MFASHSCRFADVPFLHAYACAWISAPVTAIVNSGLPVSVGSAPCRIFPRDVSNRRSIHQQQTPQFGVALGSRCTDLAAAPSSIPMRVARVRASWPSPATW
jgi:hypothetical protein